MRIRRGLSVLIAAMAIPVSVIVMSGQTADASRLPPPPPVNATSYTVTCSSFSGSLHFNPPARSNVGPFSGSIGGKVAGCTAEPNGGGTPVDIASGKVTGPITFDVTTDQSDCSVFLGTGDTPVVFPANATLTIVWKMAKGTPALSSGNSVIQLANVVSQSENPVSLSAPGSPGGVNGTGSFAGTDGGASDSLTFDGESSSTVFGQCFSRPGMHRLTFGGTPLDLG
jgi:hypothetical protein